MLPGNACKALVIIGRGVIRKDELSEQRYEDEHQKDDHPDKCLFVVKDGAEKSARSAGEVNEEYLDLLHDIGKSQLFADLFRCRLFGHSNFFAHTPLLIRGSINVYTESAIKFARIITTLIKKNRPCMMK